MKSSLVLVLIIASAAVFAETRYDSPQCPSGSFWNTQACMPCANDCSTTCTSYKGTCQSGGGGTTDCVAPKVVDGNGNCISCPDGCAECTLEGNKGFKCKTCIDLYQEIEDICILISPGTKDTVNSNLKRYQKYEDNSTKPKIPEGIPKSCKSLDSNTALCKECSDGSFFNEEGLCEPCPDKCAQCTARGTCAQCVKNASWVANVKRLDGSGSISGACVMGEVVTDCNDRYYLDTTTKKCVACSDGCQTCNSSGCQTCFTGYFLNSGSCSFCPGNTALNKGVCVSCNIGKEKACDTCSTGYTLVSGLCQLCSLSGCANCGEANKQISCIQCKNGFYLSIDRTTNVGSCTACSTISDPLNAYLCNKDDKSKNDNPTVFQCQPANDLSVYALTSSNYFTIVTSGKVACVANSNSCYKMVDNTGKCSDCVSGYYLKSDTKVCTSCSSTYTNCDACTNDPVCSTCKDGYIVSQDKKSCIKCPDNCTTCALGSNGTSAICNQCLDAYAATTDKTSCTPCSTRCLQCDSTGKCSKCELGFKPDGTSCTPCSVSYCNDCSSDVAKCNKCSGKMYLYTDSTNVQKCLFCPPGCLDCSSSNNQSAGQKCNSCLDGYFKKGDGCTSGVDYCAKYNDDGTCNKCMYGLRESGGICYRCVGMLSGYVCGENAGSSSCFSQLYQSAILTFLAAMILILQ